MALGANLGDPSRTLQEAFQELERLSVEPLRRSSLWRSKPIDCPPGSPDFLNAAAILKPAAGETPFSLLERLQAIERRFGRVRAGRPPNAPRRLDLDLIAFGDLAVRSSFLTLPHPRAHLRRFVLAPLAEIAPDLVLPLQREPVRTLLAKCPASQWVEKVG